MTQRQELLVQALGTGQVKTITAAAKKVGMSRQSAHEALAKPDIQAKLARLREKVAERQGDKARRIANKSLGRIESAVDVLPDDDPREVVQVAGMAIVAAAKHSEAYGTGEPEVNEDEARDKLRELKRRYFAMGARWQRWQVLKRKPAIT